MIANWEQKERSLCGHWGARELPVKLASVPARRSCCSEASEGLRVLPGMETPDSCTTEVSDNHLPEAMTSSQETLHMVIPHLRKEPGLRRCGFLGQFSLCLAGYHGHTLFEWRTNTDLENITASVVPGG